ncbi:DUF4912 domain-containing protein [Peribacillus alkalitolerans]|uniref:DUF4912 domain-containing protein n=1 Tax=Peribacillus alkalitolerans TaxID=1550385 RepID=UPI0013D48BA3|nr:DUF4912 domain-containing protein [Peribacillus alkalitolerans]
MIEEIIDLRNKGLSFRKIAKQMNTTVGKIQYQWKKHMNQELPEETEKKIRKSKPIYQVPLRKEHVLDRHSLSPNEKNSKILLIQRNEESVLVYWTFSEMLKMTLQNYYGKAIEQFTFMLRLYDVSKVIFNGNNAHYYTDAVIPSRQNHWILNGLKPSRSYLVEVGLLQEDGNFMPLLRSNTIQTPRNELSQCGQLSSDIQKWSISKKERPNWVEHISTYSYYNK